jgi:RNA polymerase sigma-70 factor (ECF subfamily)
MITTEDTMQLQESEIGMRQRDLVRVLVAERVKMLAYIDSLVRDENLAEDLFQEVCMLAAEKAAAIQDEEHLLKWLRTTARFHAMNAIKKRRNQAASLDSAVLDQLEVAWQRRRKDDEASAWTDALRGCLDRLPARSRDLVSRRYVENVAYAKLAVEMNRPVASLYVTFSRIFATLSDCINQQMEFDGKRIRG